jgi:hypothetical protein
MSAHQTEMAVLRQIILYEDSDECRKLERSLAQVQHAVRCVQRAAWVTTLFLLLALAGVAYGVLLHENFPYNGSELAFRALCELGLASLLCLVGFAGLLTVYRQKLNRLRKDCLQLVIRLLESRLGQLWISNVVKQSWSI